MQCKAAEDNEAMMKICKSGQSQKMRHLGRTHRVSIQSIVELFQNDPSVKMEATKTIDQAADIYTKRFIDPRKWQQLLYLNNIVDPDTYWEAADLNEYITKNLKKLDVRPLKAGGWVKDMVIPPKASCARKQRKLWNAFGKGESQQTVQLPVSVASKTSGSASYKVSDAFTSGRTNYSVRDSFYVQLMSKHAVLPKRISARAPGYDLASAHAYSINPSSTAKVKTDIKLQLSHGMFARIARGRDNLDIVTGIIQSSYNGIVEIEVSNRSDKKLHKTRRSCSRIDNRTRCNPWKED